MNFIDTYHQDIVHDISFDFFGKRVATCSSDRKVKIFYSLSPNKWKKIYEFIAHDAEIRKVKWAHPEFGSILATCSYDKSVIIWEEPKLNLTIEEGVLVPKQNENSTWIYKTKLLDSKESIEDIKFAPKHLGLMLATGSAEGIFRIYEVPDVLNLAFWRIIVEYSVASFPITSISWSKNPFEVPMLAVAVKCFQSRTNEVNPGGGGGGEEEVGGEGGGRGGRKGRGGDGEGGDSLKGRGEDKKVRGGKGGRGKGEGAEKGGGEEEGRGGDGGGGVGKPGLGGLKLGNEKKGDIRTRLRGEAGSLGVAIIGDGGLKSGSVVESGLLGKQMGRGEGGAPIVGGEGRPGIGKKVGEEERKDILTGNSNNGGGEGGRKEGEVGGGGVGVVGGVGGVGLGEVGAGAGVGIGGGVGEGGGRGGEGGGKSGRSEDGRGEEGVGREERGERLGGVGGVGAGGGDGAEGVGEVGGAGGAGKGGAGAGAGAGLVPVPRTGAGGVAGKEERPSIEGSRIIGGALSVSEEKAGAGATEEKGLGIKKEKSGLQLGSKEPEGSRGTISVQTGRFSRAIASPSIQNKEMTSDGLEKSSAGTSSILYQAALPEEQVSATSAPAPDSTLKIFASFENNWELIKNLHGHEGGVNDVSWAPINGRSYEMLVSGGKNEIIVWNVKVEGKRINVFRMENLDYGDYSVVWKVSWNMMATVLASSDERNVVKLWKRGGSRWKCVGILNEEEDEESKESNLSTII